MSFSSLVRRLLNYYGRQGFRATMRRVVLAARRTLFENRTVLFYCDLPALASLGQASGMAAVVEEKTPSAGLTPAELRELTGEWNPEVTSRKVRERFARGAHLWLIRLEGRLAGYGWTLEGGTMEPHYLPLGVQDVHLFDFHVFEEFRGRGINPYLVNSILGRLAGRNGGRAFIEAAEWNVPQLNSLGKTPFHYLGVAGRSTILGHTIVSWRGERRKQTEVPNSAPQFPPDAKNLTKGRLMEPPKVTVDVDISSC